MKRLLSSLSLATALAVVTSSSALASTLVTVSGPSPYAACTADAGTGRTNYVNAEVEPMLAVDPSNGQHLVGAWQQDRWSNGGAHGLAAAASFNGGRTWTETTQPFSICAPGGVNFNRASDPWVTIGPDGIVYANAVSFERIDNRNAIVAAASYDGGLTWTNVTRLVDFETNGGQFSTDKNSITANPKLPGVAYSVWDTLIGPTDQPDDNPHAQAFTGPGFFSMTSDGGRTWSAPRVIFPTTERNQTIGNIIVVDPNHPNVLYDFTNWIIQPATFKKEHDQIAFIKSTDGGATWSTPRAIRDMNVIAVTDPNTGALIRTGDILPEPAIDPSTGQLYIVYQTTDLSGGAFDEVALITSTDGGATWSEPVRVNTPTGAQAFTPSVAVNSAGQVGVTYYDFRNLQPGNATTLPTDYFIRISSDHGQTFAPDVHITGSFDMLTAPFARGFFVGDYEALGVAGTTFIPFFVAANSGNTSNRTDVFATRI